MAFLRHRPHLQAMLLAVALAALAISSSGCLAWVAPPAAPGKKPGSPCRQGGSAVDFTCASTRHRRWAMCASLVRWSVWVLWVRPLGVPRNLRAHQYHAGTDSGTDSIVLHGGSAWASRSGCCGCLFFVAAQQLLTAVVGEQSKSSMWRNSSTRVATLGFASSRKSEAAATI